MKKAILLLLATIGLAFGCATSSKKMNSLSIGMTKEQVVALVGEPKSTRAIDGTEYLMYHLAEGVEVKRDFLGNGYLNHKRGDYFVRIRNGKVDAYGHVGDFDSTKIPETKQTIDLNINK
jgi:hypothetical protein